MRKLMRNVSFSMILQGNRDSNMLQTQRLDDVDKAEKCKLEYETVICSKLILWFQV